MRTRRVRVLPRKKLHRRRPIGAPKEVRFLFSLLIVAVLASFLAIIVGKGFNFISVNYEPLKEAVVNATRAFPSRDIPPALPRISAVEQADNKERLAMKQLLLASAEKMAELSGDKEAKQIAAFLEKESFLVKLKGDEVEALEPPKKIEFVYLSGADTANFARWPKYYLGERNDNILAWFIRGERRRLVYLENNYTPFFAGSITIHEGRHAMDADSGFTKPQRELRAQELDRRIFLSFPGCRRAVEMMKKKILREIGSNRRRILDLDFPRIYFDENEINALNKTCGPAVNAEEVRYRSGRLHQYACWEIISQYFPQKADSLKLEYVKRFLL